ncbi:MAG: hypothetical protein V1865_01235 [bacterium]
MKNEFNLFNMRFIIPPVITIFTVIGLSLMFDYTIIGDIKEKLLAINDLLEVIISIIGVSTTLLTLGFIISSISILIITLKSWDATNLNATYSKNIEERNIKEVYVLGNLLFKGQKKVNNKI